MVSATGRPKAPDPPCLAGTVPEEPGSRPLSHASGSLSSGSLASRARGVRGRHRCGDDRRARSRRRRAGAGGRRGLPRAHAVLPAPGVGRAQCGRDLGGRVRHLGRGGRPPRRCGPGGGGHRHHESARDPGGVRPLDRAAVAPRHRVAGPADRRHLRRARRRGASAHGAGEDGADARPVFHRHEDHVALAARGARPRPRRPPTSPSGRSTAGCCGT